MLGHADIQTTMIYLHEQDRIVNAAEHHIPNFSRFRSPERVTHGVHARGEWRCGGVTYPALPSGSYWQIVVYLCYITPCWPGRTHEPRAEEPMGP